MLHIPVANTTLSTQIVEDQNITKLFTALQAIDRRPNMITLAQFRQFEPLFRKNNTLTETEIHDLTKLYAKTIDFYKETQIIESSVKPTVVLTLPPLFTPVRTLSTTDTNEAIVAANQKMSGHHVPKYSSEAFNTMMNALKREQLANKSVIDAYHRNYVTIVDAFFAAYRGEVKSAAIVETSQPSAVPAGTEWDFD
jgi:hypothetical protein